MAAKIKLQRKGTKSKPKYRFIIQETRTKLNGKAVDILGEYEPQRNPSFINLDKEKVEKWLKIGAEPTDKVRILLGKAGILPAVDTSVLTKRKPKKEVKTDEASPAAAGEAKA